jgi:hypothetical protein
VTGKTIVQGVEDLVTVYQTLFFDLPLAGTKWGLGIGKEQEVTETAWKSYDAGVRLATASIDTLYRSPVFGEVVARSLDVMLRWQRLSNALVGASVAGLWPILGLPTAATVQGLRAEVQTLREELRSAASDLRLAVSPQANGKRAPHPLGSLREERHSRGVGLLGPGRESTTRPTDVSEYFEPVAEGAQSAPGPEHTVSAARPTDLSEYFEPVADDTQATPGPGQRAGNERDAIPKRDVQTEALQTEVSSTAHSLPPWPPYSRAGGGAAHKRAAKGNTLR